MTVSEFTWKIGNYNIVAGSKLNQKLFDSHNHHQSEMAAKWLTAQLHAATAFEQKIDSGGGRGKEVLT